MAKCDNPGGRFWYDRVVLPVQSVPTCITTKSSSPVHGEVYSIQHYVIKFDRDL
jgi:hypothetical protein